MSRTKIFLIIILSLTSAALATSPASNGQKIPAQTFFIPDEIPPIGNLLPAQLQLLEMVHAVNTPSQNMFDTAEVYTYAVHPNSPRMWGSLY
ncbi:hypothetical protein BH09DEP1_BH09DEP1_8580 [soil metagenome]